MKILMWIYRVYTKDRKKIFLLISNALIEDKTRKISAYNEEIYRL